MLATSYTVLRARDRACTGVPSSGMTGQQLIDTGVDLLDLSLDVRLALKYMYCVPAGWVV